MLPTSWPSIFWISYERKDRRRLDCRFITARFLVNEALPGTGIDVVALYAALADILGELGPENQAALAERDQLQLQLDEWYKAHPGPIDVTAYKAFLVDIGFLEPVAEDSASTSQASIEFVLTERRRQVKAAAA